MRIFISAGEPSGDHHAGDLVRALRDRLPDAEFVGFGGKHMARAGARLLYPLTDLAIMWFLQAITNLRTFFGLLKQADDYFRDQKPDALIVIDYPGFHWHLARKAKERGVPVFYYVPPQLWAWAGWRVKKVQKYVDHLLCSLPFEPAWYEARGVQGAEYVGHPFFDERAERVLDEEFRGEQAARGGPLVLILPGSRTLELKRNLPTMLRAAALLAAERPGTRFAVSCLHEKHRLLAQELVAELGLAALVPGLELYAGRTAELMSLADLAWAVSGSVSLELMVETVPTVVLYKIRPIDLWIARPFIKARYITLVNLLADAELMPEYLTARDEAPELVRWARTWLDDPAARAQAIGALKALRDQVARPGASQRAADRIVAALGVTPPIYRGPHDPTLPAHRPRRSDGAAEALDLPS